MKKIVGFLCALLLSGNVLAVDGVFVDAGRGQQTDAGRVGAIWNMDRQWFTEGSWQVSGYWEASVASLQGKSNAANNQRVTDLAITPVFRLQQKSPAAISPYFEGAIGFNLISPTFVNDGRRLGSAFQFGDHIGLGITFGDHHQFELGYRFQHISNGGIKQPNQGLNLNLLHFVYHF